ncbi:uncharacterized protein ACRADG_001998 [Cochliomyia hominivorax]
MKSERDQSYFVIKLLIVLLICILLTIYNSFYYDFKIILGNRIQRYYGNDSYNESSMENFEISKPPKGFLVWSSNCHMPSMDPFQSIYMSDYVPQIGPNCSTKDPLIVKKFNEDSRQYTLHIDMNLKDLYTEKNLEIKCCYQQILRKGEKDYKLLDCENFKQDYKVPNDIDYMLITCRDTSKNNTIVYQDGLSFIQDRASVKAKINAQSQRPIGRRAFGQRPFGILLFGIDSLSQFNFRRVMPKTFQYVQNHSWFELSGYNKVDDNTFPNLMAIFTGYSLQKSAEMCKIKEINGLDNCPTLFRFSNEQGLTTAYSEDECAMSTFTYLRPGFNLPPTDYYQRPLLMAMEKKLPIRKLSGLKYCMGPRRAGEYVYDFGVEFATRFLGKSIFGLFWANSFSHNYWRDPHTMDERLVKYLNDMDENGILDNNIVVLFSDHGSRFGFLRSEKDGYIEERLPMFFLRMPQWFQQKYPKYVQSLKVNKHRLTSPYDFHMTLKHLMFLSQGKEFMYNTLEPPLSCPTCHTLFRPVSENRTCEEAGLEDHWCTCTPFQAMKTGSSEMQNLTKLVINKMNDFLKDNGYEKKCAPLTFKKNVEANLKMELHQDSNKMQKQTYRMNFKVMPNEAEFDATFVYDNLNKNISIDVTEISRLNIYAEDAKCIDNNNIVKKFCICYESIKKET